MAVTNPTRAFHRVTNWEVATGLCVRSLLPDEERVCKACGKQRGFLHDEHCNPAGPNATIRHNHVNFAHSGLGDASRSPGLQRIHNRCFFQAQRYPVGEPKLLSPHGRCRLRGSGDRLRCYCRVSTFGKGPPDIRNRCPEPIPTYRRTSSLKTSCAPSWIESIKTTHSSSLRAGQSATRHGTP